MPKPELIEDEIARKLAEAQQSGELKSAPSYGRPLAMSDGWDDTPDEFRMAFKMLKNSGFVPPEIAVFHERAELRKRLATCADLHERKVLETELAQLEQKIALRLEAMKMHGGV